MKKFRIAVSWFAVFAVMCTIFYFSSQPAAASDKTSGGVIALVYGIYAKFSKIPAYPASVDTLQFAVRKCAHFTIYLLLGLCFANAYIQSGIKSSRKAAAFSLLCSAFYAATDEFHQLFVPGRSGEIRDVCLDSAGALTGIIIFIWVAKKWISKRQ